MIEVRSFQGGTEELAEFVAKTWRKTYEGRMPIPHWTADFFARDGGSDGVFLNCTIAAYDGARLIGVVPGWRVPVRFHGEEVLVRTGTGVCVDSEYQGHGVGKLMNQRALEHAREHGCALTLFYLYSRSPDFKGNKFWRSRGMTTREICRLGMWSRPLNPTRVSQWELWRFEAWGTRLLGPFLRGVRPAVAPDAIRELRPDDMPACASLIREAGSSMDVARLFDERTLERQLAYKDVARTWVVEHEGRVAGLVNVCYLDIFGRCLERFGVIDLLAFDPALPHWKRVDLLRVALRAMEQDGLIAATMIRGSWNGARALLAAGFLPLQPEYHLVGIKHREDISFDKIRRLQVLWR
ncbi:MAG: GNAT family N-acetyltransferase [Rhodopirellula sp.]|nr:GNAT family N-acetyltransferase [Rhodopirellula sp.]